MPPANPGPSGGVPPRRRQPRRDGGTYVIWLLFSIGLAAIGLTGLAASIGAALQGVAEVAHAVRGWVG